MIINDFTVDEYLNHSKNKKKMEKLTPSCLNDFVLV